jgi:hypothetical protein
VTSRPHAALRQADLALMMADVAGLLRQAAPKISDVCFEASIRLLSPPRPTEACIASQVRVELRRLGIDPDLGATEAVHLATLVGAGTAEIVQMRPGPRV